MQGVSPLTGAPQSGRWGVINPRRGGQWCSDEDIPGWVVVVATQGDSPDSSVRQCVDPESPQCGAIAMQARDDDNEPVPGAWVVMNPRTGLHPEVEARVADWVPLVPNEIGDDN